MIYRDELYRLLWGIFWCEEDSCRAWLYSSLAFNLSLEMPPLWSFPASVCKRMSLKQNTKCSRAELRQATQKELGWEGLCIFVALSWPPCWDLLSFTPRHQRDLLHLASDSAVSKLRAFLRFFSASLIWAQFSESSLPKTKGNWQKWAFHHC